MINYAHRGASQYAPENTLPAFYLGLLQGANGIETDVQLTADGHLVLFHDDTLDRVTNGTGPLAERTLQELRQLKVGQDPLTGFYGTIPTYREFLEHFARYDIRLAIELKGPGTEAQVLALSREFHVMERTTFTSFSLDYLRKMKALCPAARVGWLVRDPSEAEIAALLAIGAEEIAPNAAHITTEKIAFWRSLGLGVRAWGVKNTALMEQMCALGVDGMTVNFPDLLCRYLCKDAAPRTRA